MQFMGADPILAIYEEPHGREPLAKRDGRVLEDSAAFDRELDPAIPALPPLLRFEIVRLLGLAFWAMYPVRKQHFHSRINADLLIAKVLNGFE